ncbi:hypothetical protein ADUPG1_012015, partial [Aduncisulcus paluster]
TPTSSVISSISKNVPATPTSSALKQAPATTPGDPKSSVIPEPLFPSPCLPPPSASLSPLSRLFMPIESLESDIKAHEEGTNFAQCCIKIPIRPSPIFPPSATPTFPSFSFSATSASVGYSQASSTISSLSATPIQAPSTGQLLMPSSTLGHPSSSLAPLFAYAGPGAVKGNRVNDCWLGGIPGFPFSSPVLTSLLGKPSLSILPYFSFVEFIRDLALYCSNIYRYYARVDWLRDYEEDDFKAAQYPLYRFVKRMWDGVIRSFKAKKAKFVDVEEEVVWWISELIVAEEEAKKVKQQSVSTPIGERGRGRGRGKGKGTSSSTSVPSGLELTSSLGKEVPSFSLALFGISSTDVQRTAWERVAEKRKNIEEGIVKRTKKEDRIRDLLDKRFDLALQFDPLYAATELTRAQACSLGKTDKTDPIGRVNGLMRLRGLDIDMIQPPKPK